MNILDAAKYIVYLSYVEKMGSLTPLKLQKVLYLAQGWSYVWDNKELFTEEFQAWQYGPVNEMVYNYFKKYRKDEIPFEEAEALTNYDEIEDKKTIEAVWDTYSEYSASSLVEITHSQLPWINAFNNSGKIPNIDIKKYFQAVYL